MKALISTTLMAIGIAARPYQYTMDTKLNHADTTDDRTFKMRYIVDD